MTYLWIAICLIASFVDDPLREFQKEAQKWEEEIRQLETKDLQEIDPKDGILFVGSSSIRLWDTIHRDMMPWPAIQRGFGGSKMTDIAIYVDRLIAKHDYRALVVFAANDVTGGDQDHTPKQVGTAFQIIIDRSKAHEPSAPIFVIAVTPTESRWKVWDKIQQVNQELRNVASQNDKVYFIDTCSSYLNESGAPKTEFFKDDKLHQNELGYANWARLIKADLSKTFGDSKK